MSRRIPVLAGRERPANLAVLMRETFVAINDLVIARLGERGHGDVRPAHAAVFQYLDDTGPTVSDLGGDVIAVAQALVPELEGLVTELLGADRVLALRADLDTIRHAITAYPRTGRDGPA